MAKIFTYATFLLVVILVPAIGWAADPAITSPTPGSTFSGSTVTFTWTSNGTNVQEYWMEIGSTPTSRDIHDSGSLGLSLTTTVSGMPTDGRQVFVRFWWLTEGNWELATIEYTATTIGGGGTPAITSPTPGTTLSGPDVTFTWTSNGTTVDAYWVEIGSADNTNDLYNSGSLAPSVLSTAVSGLPTDGRQVFVKFWWLVNGTWGLEIAQYTASGAPVMHTLTVSKTGNGTVLSAPAGINCGGDCSENYTGGTSVTLTPNPDSGWQFDSWSGHGDCADGNVTMNGARTCTANFSQTPPGNDPAITSPTPGSTLSGPDVTFAWISNGTNVTEWWLYIGSTLGGYDVHDSGSLGTNLSTFVSNLPTDGRQLYVRLWYKVSGTWEFSDFQYTASGTPASDPEITSPTPESTLSGPDVTFTWISNGTNVTEWWLYIGSNQGAYDVHDSGSLGTNLSTLVSNLPTDGRLLYVRLWYKVSGTWEFSDFQFTASGCCAGGSLGIVTPSDLEVVTSSTIPIPSSIAVSMQTSATGFPSNWGVEFVVDGISLTMDTVAPYSYVTNLVPGEHSLTVYMVDESLVRQTTYSDQVNFGVGDYYVAFGDSITAETGDHDDIPGDDNSADGRNSGGGYQPILNDILTNSKGYSHTVENEGVSGDESIDGVNRIGSVLANHPNAKYFLILLGTNDSWYPIPSGVGLICTGLDMPSNDPGCPGTYKDNMQKIINAIVQAGKVPLLAKVPIKYGDCSSGQCWTFPNPSTAAVNLLISQEYNVAIDELRSFNGIEGTLGNPLTSPDLYTYFEGTPLDSEGKSVEYDDIIHPGGLGYQSIANLWLQALTE